GFETRGTTLSNARLTLDAIEKAEATAVDILLSNLQKHVAKRQAKTFKLSNNSDRSDSFSEAYMKEKLREASPSTKINALSTSTPNYTTTLEPISIDYNDYGTDTEPKVSDLSDPCVQYSAMGTRIPYEYMDYMAKIIFEIKAKEVFSVDVFRRLCEVDAIVDKLLNNSIYQPTKLPTKHSFNLPFYANCLQFSTPNRCDAINDRE
ncbi:hypothetical protein GCK32_019311, partial [Trichostrongylus colubriformis]